MIKPQVNSVTSFDHQPLYTESYSNHPHPKYQFVFIHGFGGDSNATLPAINQLLHTLPRCQCITYDLRGHGFSTTKFPSQTFVEQTGALDLQSICHAYSLTHPIFIGHSFGSIILYQYLLNKLSPQPTNSFLICFPVVSPRLPFRRLLQSFLSHTSQNLPPNQHKRNLTIHHQLSSTHDISLTRLYSDYNYSHKYIWLIHLLIILGYQPQTLSSSSSKLYFLFGQNDVLIQPKSALKQLPKLVHNYQTKILASNHHNCYTAHFVDLSNYITNLLT